MPVGSCHKEIDHLFVCKLLINNYLDMRVTGKFVSDVDECAENSTICENGKFCDNTPGSHVCRGKYMFLFFGGEGFGLDNDLLKWFICLSTKVVIKAYFVHFSGLLTSCVVISVCHSACDTCIGEGSQGCTKCNTGYKMADNECKGKARTKILLRLILGFKGSIHDEILPIR